MTIPTPGRIVHYTLHEGKNEGQVRPAVITRVRGEGIVDLTVFLVPEDSPRRELFAHVDQVDESQKLGTPRRWTWPELLIRAMQPTPAASNGGELEQQPEA